MEKSLKKALLRALLVAILGTWFLCMIPSPCQGERVQWELILLRIAASFTVGASTGLALLWPLLSAARRKKE